MRGATRFIFSLERTMATLSVADKAWWGPRIWRILHSMAEISERTDCLPLWRIMLHATADMLPCTICKSHFRTFISKMRFPVRISSSEAVIYLRRSLWLAHHEVGGILPEGDVPSEYGGSREEITRRVKYLVSEIDSAFRNGRVLDRFHSAALPVWIRRVERLLHFIQTPLHK
jgi:hypothetical protein